MLTELVIGWHTLLDLEGTPDHQQFTLGGDVCLRIAGCIVYLHLVLLSQTIIPSDIYVKSQVRCDLTFVVLIIQVQVAALLWLWPRCDVPIPLPHASSLNMNTRKMAVQSIGLLGFHMEFFLLILLVYLHTYSYCKAARKQPKTIPATTLPLLLIT